MRRTGYKKSEESRRQVLDAAIRTIAERGIAGTSVQDIADAAGLSKGVVHYHFESKQELLEHVLDQSCNVLLDRVQQTFEEPGEPLERVWRAVLEMWRVRRDGVAEARVLSEFFVLARQNESLRRALDAALAKERVRITETGFLPLLDLGIKPRVPIGAAVRLLVATLDGLALHHDVTALAPADEEKVLGVLRSMVVTIFDPEVGSTQSDASRK